MNAHDDHGEARIAMIRFVSEELRRPVRKISVSDSLFHDLGVDGDDAVELIESYATTFGVDIDGFDFGIYFGPEGAASPWGLISELITKKHYNSKKRLTIEDLVNGARSGKLE